MENMNNINEWRLWELIALLREHCRKHYWFKDNDVIDIDHDSVSFHLYHNAKRYFSIGVEKVICKEFWFIKWLVENDKVDWNFIDYAEIHQTKRELESNYELCDIEKQYYERLLMLLSIQDNPIEFLVSILK